MEDYTTLSREEFNTKFVAAFKKYIHKDFYGIESLPGWNNLIWTLTETLARYAGHSKTPFKISQIKQKFGGLRYYCSGNETMQGMVDLAESLSFTLCEKCGARGVLDTDYGYVLTLCPFHKEERNREKEVLRRKFRGRVSERSTPSPTF